MSRYKDADALTKAIKQDADDNVLTERYVFYRINEAPTIEVVSAEDYRSMENTCYKLQKALYEMAEAPSIDIVRCAECKHWCCHDDVDYDQTEFVYYCEINGITFKGDDFCSRGERKGSE